MSAPDPTAGKCTAGNDPLVGILELSLPHDDATAVLRLLAQAWDEGWQRGQLWAFSDLDEHAKTTNPYQARAAHIGGDQ